MNHTTVLRVVFSLALLVILHGATCPPDPWDGFVEVENPLISNPAYLGAVILYLVVAFLFIARGARRRALRPQN